jgi:hypothetical protein
MSRKQCIYRTMNREKTSRNLKSAKLGSDQESNQMPQVLRALTASGACLLMLPVVSLCKRNVPGHPLCSSYVNRKYTAHSEKHYKKS